MIITVTRREEVAGEAQGPAGAVEEEAVTCLVVGVVVVVVKVDTEVVEEEGVTRQDGATGNRRTLSRGTIKDPPHSGATACQGTQSQLSGT